MRKVNYVTSYTIMIRKVYHIINQLQIIKIRYIKSENHIYLKTLTQ